MFDKVLIANRGEIALRVLRACKEIGIATVAVHSTADADAMHVRLADESVCIGPPPAAESYLNIPRLLAACEITGADAVHPGYGFLSENARFAEILEEHGITFIGPTSEHIRIMGDKIEAKATAKRLGIPVVPGSDGAITDEAQAHSVAKDMGYPGAGQGGSRRRRARHEGGPHGRRPRHAPSRRRAPRPRPPSATTASTSRSIWQKPRHIEVQVFGDGKGNAIHLGERDCSLQRRHQKVLEEAPSPALNAESAQEDRHDRRQGDAEAQAIAAPARSSSSTRTAQFFFIEMNTRLQVEHPVTEMITGLDLVIEQIRIASGAPLTLHAGARSTLSGHAIECRINAENPRTFRPSPGTITYWHPPGGLGVRVDSGAYQGYRIPPYYDSLIGKLIVHGKNRNECLMRLKRCLSEFVIDGIETTIPLFADLVQQPDIANGLYDIHWLEKFLQKAIIGMTQDRCDKPRLSSGRAKIGTWPRATTSSSRSRRRCCSRPMRAASFPWRRAPTIPALYWIEPQQRGILLLDQRACAAAARADGPPGPSTRSASTATSRA